MKKPILFGDFETKSAADLKTVGVWNYAHHPSTDVLCFGFAFDNDAPSIWTPGHISAKLIASHIQGGGEFVAHNAPFELAIWNTVMVEKYGWPELKPEQVICTMARAYAMALPGSLDDATAALGLPGTKDKTGHALMMRVSCPMNRKEVSQGKPAKWALEQESFTFMGKKITPDEALEMLYDYCKQDVVAERLVYERTLPLSNQERRTWIMDRRINERGFLFDPEAVAGAIELKDQALADMDRRMSELTDGAVQSTTALPALKEWMEWRGFKPESLAKNLLDGYIKDETLHPDVRAALSLRQEGGRGTSVAKLEKARALAGADGRVRNIIQYHGAATGRFAGRGLQPHNFPRDLPKPESVAFLMRLLAARDGEMLAAMEDNPLAMISRLLRGFIMAEPGKQLVGGDWSNVEGRGLAWLAGEEWKVDAFRAFDAGKGPDLYKKTYAGSFNVPVEEVDKEQRQIGKVMELAFGYQGGVGAFHQMANIYGVVVDDEKAEEFKVAWRNAHPMVVQYWPALQKAAIRAIQHPGTMTSTSDAENRWGDRFADRPLPPRDRAVRFKVTKPGPFLYCRLPSGRLLTYPYPRLDESDYGPKITYMSVPSPDEWKAGRIVDDPRNSRKWARISTYGGKLAENVTQAICRDILTEAMLRLADRDFDPVLHIHDEVICEGLYNEKSRTRIQEILETPPLWAEDLPLAADCWLNDRYQK